MKPGLFFASSRNKSWLAHWPYLLLFCAALFIFLGLFHLESTLRSRLGSLEVWALKNNIRVKDENISKFPPAISIKEIELPVGSRRLKIQEVEASLGFFPPRINLRGQFAGGAFQCRGRISPGPEIADVEIQVDGVSLSEILDLMPQKQPFFEPLAGRLSASGDFRPAWAERNPDWGKFRGQLNLNLAGGELRQKLPLLKQDTLNNINGEAILRFEGLKCFVEQCDLRSGEFGLELRGTVDPWLYPDRARLNLESILRVNASQVEERLLPARSAAQIKKNGLVRARISQTLSTPRLRLEN